MADKVQTPDITPGDEPTPTPPKRSPGHRGTDVRDAVAEMTARAHEISLEAGSKMAAALKDVVNAAAGLAGFAIESTRDLVQYMVRRGQMTQDEADKLLRDAEEAHARRKGATATVEREAAPVRTEPRLNQPEPRPPEAVAPAPAAPSVPAVKKSAPTESPQREPAVKVAQQPAAKVAAKSGARPAAKAAEKPGAAKKPSAAKKPGAAKGPAKSGARSGTKSGTKSGAKSGAKARAQSKKPAGKKK